MKGSFGSSGYPAPAQARTLIIYGALFAAAGLAFSISKLRFGLPFGAVDMLSLAGNATCGWAWLVIRTTFRPAGDPIERWPLALVLTIVALEAVIPTSGEPASQGMRMLAILSSLISSAVLLMAAIEPLRGFDRRLPMAERRFRLAFFGFYVMILSVAVLWVDSAISTTFTNASGLQVKAVCATAAVVGIGAAVWYRVRNPMPAIGQKEPREADPSVLELAPKLQALLESGGLHSASDLRVADLAMMLGEPEYKVTQAITRGLGYANFNRMINRYRIEQAMTSLSDPAQDHLPVLTIALDCGFGSIGPFNRAFKDATGMTPSTFRSKREYRHG